MRCPGHRTDRGPHSWLVESDLLRNSKCDPESEDLLTSCSLDASFTSFVSSLCSPVNQQSFCPSDSNTPNPSSFGSSNMIRAEKLETQTGQMHAA